MSTKIYYAFRISKKKDILKIFAEVKKQVKQFIAEDKLYLKILHSLYILDLLDKYTNQPNHKRIRQYTSALVDHINKELDIFSFKMFLESNSFSELRGDMSAYFSCSVFYDRRYWYIKFFPNQHLDYKIMDYMEEKYNLQDYHYQNQTDSPDDISYKNYKKRDKKWDQLTKLTGGNYLGGFQYDLLSPEEIMDEITKYYYTGKPLYDHLVYKFDENFITDEKIKEILKEQENNNDK